MRSCSNCLLPETAEATTFDSQGTCSVCKQIEYKEEKVDWPDRRRQLDELVSLYKDKEAMERASAARDKRMGARKDQYESVETHVGEVKLNHNN